MTPKIAITGANGFIGRILLDSLLSRGWKVQALSRSRPPGLDERGVRWISGDLMDSDSNSLTTLLDGVDVVIHCAGELHDKSVMWELHVEGTKRLIAVARGRVGHWVQLSSCGVYGPVRSGIVTEASPFNPVGMYEESKLQAEKIVVDAMNDGDFSATILRPSNIYGETMTNQSLRVWISVVERGQFFYVGRRGAMTNYVHVQDVSRALCECATSERAKGRVYNLSNGCPIEFFVSAMCACLECDAPRIRLPETAGRLLSRILGRVPGFPLKSSRVDALSSRATYSSDRILNDLGFQPEIDVDEGLKRLIHSMKIN